MTIQRLEIFYARMEPGDGAGSSALRDYSRAGRRNEAPWLRKNSPSCASLISVKRPLSAISTIELSETRSSNAILRRRTPTSRVTLTESFTAPVEPEAPVGAIGAAVPFVPGTRNSGNFPFVFIHEGVPCRFGAAFIHTQLLRRSAAPDSRSMVPSSGSSPDSKKTRNANSITALSLMRSRKAKYRNFSATCESSVCETVDIFNVRFGGPGTWGVGVS